MNDAMDIERMKILERIESGEISAAEGLRLLEDLDARATVSHAAAGRVERQPEDTIGAEAARDPDLQRWKRVWEIPLLIGIAVTAVAGYLMLSAFQAAGYGFWFFCLWLPFLLGITVMVLAWFSRTAHWLHVRVDTGQQKWPQRISVSLPIPLRLTAWLLRAIRPHVPQLRDIGLDEFILAMGDTASGQVPLYVEVDGGKRGERVLVYFG